MGRSRRVVFAAPLVGVIACGGPRAPAAWQPPPIDAASVAPLDAAAAEPDAAPLAAPDDAQGPPSITSPPASAPVVRPRRMLVHVRARSIQRAGFVSCHDFGPTYRGCNPPPPERVAATTLDLPIMTIRAMHGATVVSVPLGSDDGVQRGWRVAIRTPARIPEPAAKIIDLYGNETRVATNLTAADLDAGIELELGSRTEAPWTPLVPPPAEGPIVGRAAHGRDTVLTIGVGSYDDVDRGWTVVLLDRAGEPLPGVAGTVVKVTTRATVVRVDAPVRRLRKAARARLAPP